MNPLSWKTLEFEKKERPRDWVWTVGLVALLGATVCFFYGNIFFGIFLVIAGIVTIIYSLKHPKELSISITEQGVAINEELIFFKDIKAFWLDESGKESKLLLLVKKSFVPTLSLPIVGVSTQQIREVLGGKVPEEELRESRSVALFDSLGF